MQKYGTLGHASGSAGVLQYGNVVALYFGLHKPELLSAAQCLIERDDTWQEKVWDHFLHMANHKVNHRPLGHAEHVAHGAKHHMFHLCLFNAFLQCDGKVLNDHNGLCA